MHGSDTLAAVQRLADLAASLRGHGSLLPDDAAALAAGLDLYLQGDHPLDTALGVRPTVGEVDPRRMLALARRDELICTFAGEFFGDIRSDEARAQQLRK